MCLSFFDLTMLSGSALCMVRFVFPVTSLDLSFCVLVFYKATGDRSVLQCDFQAR